MFIILTDGQENSSKDWKREAIFDLIASKREKDGWEFVFLGADQDAYESGAQIGVPPGNSLSYASARSASAYDALSKWASAWRSGQREGMDISVHQKEIDEESD